MLKTQLALNLEGSDNKEPEKYNYVINEQSVDVRSWTIESNRQLTEDEVDNIYHDSCHIEDEGSETESEPGITITYDGTEIGDDCQTDFEGDFKKESTQEGK